MKGTEIHKHLNLEAKVKQHTLNRRQIAGRYWVGTPFQLSFFTASARNVQMNSANRHGAQTSLFQSKNSSLSTTNDDKITQHTQVRDGIFQKLLKLGKS